MRQSSMSVECDRSYTLKGKESEVSFYLFINIQECKTEIEDREVDRRTKNLANVSVLALLFEIFESCHATSVNRRHLERERE